MVDVTVGNICEDCFVTPQVGDARSAADEDALDAVRVRLLGEIKADYEPLAVTVSFGWRF